MDDPQRIVDDNEINEDGGSSVVWVSYPLLGYLPIDFEKRAQPINHSFFAKKDNRIDRLAS